MNLHGLARFASDPELIDTKNSKVCKFRLVFNEVVKSTNGEKREIPSFLSFEAWDKGGEVIHKYMKKGDQIYVKDASPRQDTWKADDGSNREKVFFRLNKFEFVGGGNRRNTETKETQAVVHDEEPAPF